MHERDSSQMDGACFGKPDGPEIVEPEKPVDKMPKFLKLTAEGMLLTNLYGVMLICDRNAPEVR